MSEGAATSAPEASCDDARPLRPEVVAAVRERLQALKGVSDPSFRGPPITGLPLRPLEHGELVPDFLASIDGDGPRRRFVRELEKLGADAGIEPVLAGDAAIRAFAAFPVGAVALGATWLSRIEGEPSDAVREEIRRILGRSDLVRLCTPAAVAMSRAAGPAWLQTLIECALHDDSPFRRAEVRVLPRLSDAALVMFEAAGDWYSPAFGDLRVDPAIVLAGEPAYLEFAHEVFRLADERLEELHSGRLPYLADKAFKIEEGQVLARAARVAAKHDAPWFRALIGRVLLRVSIAPTPARTLPSQSVAIALGYAIQTDPTPEGVQALRDTLAAIRHAGVEKKLARNLKPAERGLASRAEVALRLLVDAKADKKRQTFVATCLEATWVTGGDWPLAHWRTQLAETPNGKPFALGQLWLAAGKVLRAEPVGAAGLRLVDIDGRTVDLPADARIGLWHPLHSEPAERAAWQRLVALEGLRSPVRQAFREVYEPHPDELGERETHEFAGHQLRLVPLVGLARREGWSMEGVHRSGMSRRFGDIRAWFVVDAELYPGITGNAGSHGLSFEAWQDGRWRPLVLREVPPVVYSEACRAVDLLVSVSAFALEDTVDMHPLTAGELGVRLVSDRSPAPAPARVSPAARRWHRLRSLGTRPLGAMAEMRRRALELALAPQIEAGRVAIEARHVRVGDATVHLATGRVVENGAALELPAPASKATLAAVPWLPYDEVLLQRIADSVAALLARG